MELSRQVGAFGDTCEGLEQYAVQRFANALHCVPKMLAENSGTKSSEVISQLMAAHEEGKAGANMGFNIEEASSGMMSTKDIGTATIDETQKKPSVVVDSMEKGVLDLMLLKHWGMKYATNAACTILRVDQIIMAKRAGGPKARGPGPMDQDDD